MVNKNSTSYLIGNEYISQISYIEKFLNVFMYIRILYIILGLRGEINVLGILISISKKSLQLQK